MKQISQNYKTGNIRLEEVCAPALKHGGVLVRTCYSVISSGTEGMKVREGKMSYLGKARARPDKVKQVLDSLRQQGLLATYQKVMNKLDSLTPLGYAMSGEVIAVGEGADGLYVGQKVACAGAGYANHAELNFLPKNLVVPVPASVSLKHAAFATVGAIAMQGFRQAQMQLGETACVIGLGLLGQLLTQILRAAGISVIGVDLVESRCALAKQMGAQAALHPEDLSLDAVVRRTTLSFGVDCVFIVAGGASNGPVELAARIARDRARIVDIGKTKLDLPWNDYYMKELNVRFSRSYGPGRYDPVYEEGGVDYPIGYVRWTEQRNLSAFLNLVAEGKVQLDPIISSVRPFAEAQQVYQEMADGKTDGLGVLFEYSAEASSLNDAGRNVVPRSISRPPNSVRVGVIGVGNYASSMLLPHLKKDDRVSLDAAATTTSLSAENARRKFGFRHLTTDYHDLLASQEIDAVIIATRHSSHAYLVCEALRAGKAVFVEKPLALSLEELDLIQQTIEETGNDRLMVGFNRRFSPMVTAMADQLRESRTSLVVHYRVHAGQLDANSWYLNPEEGSRFAGESGHFFDVMSYLAQSCPTRVSAAVLRPNPTTLDDLENIVTTVQYENGSIGTLSYLTQGGAQVPKEYVEVFGCQCTMQLDNFEHLTLFEKRNRRRIKAARDKGQANQMAAFISAVKDAAPMPIPLSSLMETTLISLTALRSIRLGEVVPLADLDNSP